MGHWWENEDNANYTSKVLACKAKDAIAFAMKIKGNFNTGHLEINIDGENILDLCLIELNQTSNEFQCGLKVELEQSILKAYQAGHEKALADIRGQIDKVSTIDFKRR